MAKRDGTDARILPSMPLANAVQAVVDRRTREMNWPFVATGSQHYCSEMVCEEAGCTSRNLRRWQAGHQPTVRLDTADTVLTNLDLLWWDVWNEQTVRRPLLTVMLRRKRLKRNCNGHMSVKCTERGEKHYGDAGTDWDLLAQIELMWCGDPVQGEFDQLAA